MARRGGVTVLALVLLSMTAADGGAQTPEQETVFWQSIANSTDPADFEAYLEEFPDGIFRRLAGNRLEALRDSGDPPASAEAAVGGVGSAAPDWRELVESPYDICIFIDQVPSVVDVLDVINGPAVARACYAKVRCRAVLRADDVDLVTTVMCLPTPEGGCPSALQCFLDPRVQFSDPSNLQDLRVYDEDLGRLIHPGR